MEAYLQTEIENKFKVIASKYPIFVEVENDQVVGFAYGSRWRDKPAYAKSVETTIYIHPEYKNSGIGKKLYKTLIDKLIELDFHLLVAGMTLPNRGSQKPHEKLGFEFVGRFKDAGMKFGQWHDVGFWQKVINHTEGKAS